MDADATPSAFFATLSSPASFAKLCFFLEELVDTVNLEFDPKGLRVSSVDSMHGHHRLAYSSQMRASHSSILSSTRAPSSAMN